MAAKNGDMREGGKGGGRGRGSVWLTRMQHGHMREGGKGGGRSRGSEWLAYSYAARSRHLGLSGGRLLRRSLSLVSTKSRRSRSSTIMAARERHRMEQGEWCSGRRWRRHGQQ